MAPYLEGKGKLFSFLKVYQVLLGPFFNTICNWFFSAESPRDRETNHGNTLKKCVKDGHGAGDIHFDTEIEVEQNTKLHSPANFLQTRLPLEDLKSDIQDFREDLQDIIATLERLGKNDVPNKSEILPEIQYAKKPVKEHTAVISEESEEVKKAVENVFNDDHVNANDGKSEILAAKLMKSKPKSPNSDDMRGPKLRHCSGGHENNSPPSGGHENNSPNNQVTTKDSNNQPNLATAYPNGGCGNGGGGLGGDGDDDPDKRDPEFLTKGHYQEILEPQKIKDEDELPDGSCIVQPGLLLFPVPCPKSAKSTSHAVGSTEPNKPDLLHSSESIGTTSHGNGSATMQLDPSAHVAILKSTSSANELTGVQPDHFPSLSSMVSTLNGNVSAPVQPDTLLSSENIASTPHGNGYAAISLDPLPYSGSIGSTSTGNRSAIMPLDPLPFLKSIESRLDGNGSTAMPPDPLTSSESIGSTSTGNGSAAMPLDPLSSLKSIETRLDGNGSTAMPPDPLTSSESIGSTSTVNGSAAMPLDPLSSLKSIESRLDGNGSTAMPPDPLTSSESIGSTSTGNGSAAMPLDPLPSLKSTESRLDGNGSTAMPPDPLSSSENTGSTSTGGLENEREGYGNAVSVVEEHYPEHIPTFESYRNHETQLYPFQAGLSVSIHDGRYLVNRDFMIGPEIDRGQYGVCYEIQDMSSGKTFALKKIQVNHFKQNEIDIWSSTCHPNVVTLLGAYDDGRHVHIFMELMTDTFRYLADNRAALGLNERKVAALIKPILKFLVSFHAEGYVHADLKSGNTFFGLYDIKVGDFGLTCYRGESSLDIGIHGTVPFMPMELFCGGKYYASVDIYYVGGVMIHLLSGVPAWATYPMHTIMYLVGSGEIPEIPNTCSDEMTNLLRSILNPDHTKRPTARDLLQDPMFADIPGSSLDDVLQELLVDIALFRRPAVVVPAAHDQDLGYELEAAPMTLDGADGEEDCQLEGTDHALPL